MTTDIWIENRFGEQEKAGQRIAYIEGDSILYEVMGLREHIVNNEGELAKVEELLNVDCREGYAIYPLRNGLGDFVWYNFHINLVLCIGRGIWG